MKNIQLVLLFIVMMGASIYAQDSSKKSKAGIKGGYNLSAVSFDGNSETEQLHGFHIGFYGESFIGKSASLQLELLYSQQGYKIIDGSGTYKQELDYINLPLMLKLYPSENFFLEVGPQIGLSISHKETFDSGFALYNTSQEFNPNNFDWGVNFGGGFKTNSGVSLGVRYHLGLNDIYDEDKPKNRVWQFYIGFDF
ncbi:porin family protein [Tenacibaculum caenipelagi]|uniref:Outer membrane protein with beta-barrel domain n=1 Tax=Tenacibaculum caenipelagi TaxID=1325435 RepID=A0A4R6T9E7_9FLAO|nr:porin family protein [Tenacibaculum caenipelagi]TDQ22031.1 outer membrane protein with beta-barrel domain [Tenacibaculum caenipelagi]